jgi:hypothetical protein
VQGGGFGDGGGGGGMEGRGGGGGFCSPIFLNMCMGPSGGPSDAYVDDYIAAQNNSTAPFKGTYGEYVQMRTNPGTLGDTYVPYYQTSTVGAGGGGSFDLYGESSTTRFAGWKKADGRLPFNKQFAEAFINYEFGNLEREFSFNISLSAPAGWEIKNGKFYSKSYDPLTGNMTEQYAAGATSQNPNTKVITMYLSRFAFKDASTLFITTGHELVHVGQYTDGLPDSNMYMENAAWTFTKDAADMLGNDFFSKRAPGQLQTYYQSDPRYSYTNYIPNIQFRDFVILH